MRLRWALAGLLLLIVIAGVTAVARGANASLTSSGGSRVAAHSGPRQGHPWYGGKGVQLTTAQIMELQRRQGSKHKPRTLPERESPRHGLPMNPDSPFSAGAKTLATRSVGSHGF